MDTDRDRDRVRATERQGQRQRQTETDRERDREGEAETSCVTLLHRKCKRFPACICTSTKDLSFGIKSKLMRLYSQVLLIQTNRTYVHDCEEAMLVTFCFQFQLLTHTFSALQYATSPALLTLKFTQPIAAVC